jgi:hypothetical protein
MLQAFKPKKLLRSFAGGLLVIGESTRQPMPAASSSQEAKAKEALGP